MRVAAPSAVRRICDCGVVVTGAVRFLLAALRASFLLTTPVAGGSVTVLLLVLVFTANVAAAAVAAAPSGQVDVEAGTFGMSYTEDDLFVFLDSEDGLDWEVPEWTIDISLPAGNRVEVQRVNGEIIMVVHPTEEDGEFRAFTMVPDESGGDADVEEIDLDPGPPTIVWTDEEPAPAFKVQHARVTTLVTIVQDSPRGLAIGIGGVLEGLLDD